MKELIELVKNYLNKSRIDFKYILFILCLGTTIFPNFFADITNLAGNTLLMGYKPLAAVIINFYFFLVAVTIFTLFTSVFIEFIDEKLPLDLHGANWSFGILANRTTRFFERLGFDTFVYIYLLIIFIYGAPRFDMENISIGELTDFQIILFELLTILGVIVTSIHLFNALFVFNLVQEECIPKIITNNDYQNYNVLNKKRQDGREFQMLKAQNDCYFIVEKLTEIENQFVSRNLNGYIKYKVKFHSTLFDDIKYYFDHI